MRYILALARKIYLNQQSKIWQIYSVTLFTSEGIPILLGDKIEIRFLYCKNFKPSQYCPGLMCFRYSRYPRNWKILPQIVEEEEQCSCLQKNPFQICSGRGSSRVIKSHVHVQQVEAGTKPNSCKRLPGKVPDIQNTDKLSEPVVTGLQIGIQVGRDSHRILI